MESYTREIITASQRYPENTKISEMLTGFAKSLFEEALIKISTRYDAETGKVYKQLSTKLVKETNDE